MYFFYFYPIGLDLPRRRIPWLSLLLIGSILVVFAWQQWMSDRLAIHPWDLVFYVGQARPWTAFSALLLHAGWLHLLGNLVYLAVFLPALEDRLGSTGALLAFVVTGVGGNLAHGVAAWQGLLGQDGLGVLGASGAISGLLGYSLIRLPYARLSVAYWLFSPLQGQNRAGRYRLPLPVAVMGWLLLQVVGAAVAQHSGSLVSFPAHLGGFALGLLLALGMGGLREGRAEAVLEQARRYLARGEGWPAVGAYEEYEQLLAHQEPDRQTVLEKARALVMTGRSDRAAAVYRDSYRRAVQLQRWDQALDVLAEGRRCRCGLGLSLDELASAAHQAEKAGKAGIALGIYQDLVLSAADHPVINRAWVRLLMLLHDAPDRKVEVQEWLARARAALPPGAWRDYLEQNIRVRSSDHGSPSTGRVVEVRSPGA